VTRPLIIRRMDAALDKMLAQGMEPRAIYLTPADYKLFARTSTRYWREQTGSKAYVWPTSYGDVPLINAKLIGQMVPVREVKGRKGSTAYSTHGVEVKVPKRPPEPMKEELAA
jgi:hypothetical protein